VTAAGASATLSAEASGTKARLDEQGGPTARMKTERSGLASVGWVLVGLGAALVTGGIARRSVAPVPLPDLAPPSQQARARIEHALASRARALEPRAAEAARVHELGAALDMGADHATFQDLLESEDWWGSFRSEFGLNAVVAGAKPLAVIGLGAGALGTTPLVHEARDRGTSSGVVPGHGRAFVAAAARVERARRTDDAPVVLLGTVLDQTALREIAGTTGDAVGLSDRVRLIEAAGAGEPGRTLLALVGREDRGPLLLPDGRVGAAWSLGGDLWMLSASYVPPAGPPPGQRGGLGLALAGAVLVLMGLVTAATRRPRRAEAPAASAAPADALPVSSVQLGRYRLIDRVGEGGMAEIFFAAAYGAENFVRHFVVKRMHPHLARSRELVNQFIDEARLQAGLVHYNIVPLFDFGKAGDEYFLALEYIHGCDVHQVVQRHVEQTGEPLPLPVAFFIAHEVLEALAFAHAHTGTEDQALDIVHRDVAPGNILISYQGEVKLTDFGIAKAEKRVSRTDVGMVKGNASFMSPEQARGEHVDRRSDIFSAGLVLFYCLTAQLLYPGENTLNRLLRAALGPAAPQFRQIEKLPLPAAQVLGRALAPDTSKR